MNIIAISKNTKRIYASTQQYTDIKRITSHHEKETGDDLMGYRIVTSNAAAMEMIEKDCTVYIF